MRPRDSLVTPSAHVGGLRCVHHLRCHVSGLSRVHVGCVHHSLSYHLPRHVSGVCVNLLSHVSSLGYVLCQVSDPGCVNLLCHVSGLGCVNLLRHVSGLGFIDNFRCMDHLLRSLLDLTSSCIFQRTHGLDFVHDHVLSFDDHFLTGWSIACVIIHCTLLARF